MIIIIINSGGGGGEGGSQRPRESRIAGRVVRSRAITRVFFRAREETGEESPEKIPVDESRAPARAVLLAFAAVGTRVCSLPRNYGPH